MAVAQLANGSTAARFAAADVTDRPDTLPPSFWSTHPAKLDKDAPLDLMAPGQGETGEVKKSEFYFYPDAVFSDNINTNTREWLRACWTDVDKVKEMLNSGADVHQANAFGFTGLHMAASKFKLDVAELLLEAGHEANIEEQNGLTPLDYCVDSGMQGEASIVAKSSGSRAYAQMVQLLEDHGAFRREERAWLHAANQEKYAPNLP